MSNENEEDAMTTPIDRTLHVFPRLPDGGRLHRAQDCAALDCATGRDTAHGGAYAWTLEPGGHYSAVVAIPHDEQTNEALRLHDSSATPERITFTVFDVELRTRGEDSTAVAAVVHTTDGRMLEALALHNVRRVTAHQILADHLEDGTGRVAYAYHTGGGMWVAQAFLDTDEDVETSPRLWYDDDAAEAPLVGIYLSGADEGSVWRIGAEGASLTDPDVIRTAQAVLGVAALAYDEGYARGTFAGAGIVVEDLEDVLAELKAKYRAALVRAAALFLADGEYAATTAAAVQTAIEFADVLARCDVTPTLGEGPDTTGQRNEQGGSWTIADEVGELVAWLAGRRD